MSWIKENKFIAGLAGGTLLGVIVLLIIGSQGSKKYSSAKENFDASYDEASRFEKLAVYPKSSNRDAKTTALELYKKSVDTLQTAFEPFRPKEIKNITPQEFTTVLLDANTEVRKAFEESGVQVPEAFFLGFERYKTSLASGNTTGILGYQLNSVKSLMLDLAKAKPQSLTNLYRPALAEEGGQTYTPAANVAARPLPLEITFVGTERSAREFLSSITKPDQQFIVIRTLRISNTKKEAPRASDAKFEAPAAASEEAPATDPLAGGFVIPGEGAPAADVTAAPAAAPEATSSRILSQVLGNEEVQVFLRLDLLQFLPAKKLP
jgi:hypothetical protein